MDEVNFVDILPLRLFYPEIIAMQDNVIVKRASTHQNYALDGPKLVLLAVWAMKKPYTFVNTIKVHSLDLRVRLRYPSESQFIFSCTSGDIEHITKVGSEFAHRTINSNDVITVTRFDFNGLTRFQVAEVFDGHVIMNIIIFVPVWICLDHSTLEWFSRRLYKFGIDKDGYTLRVFIISFSVKVVPDVFCTTNGPVGIWKLWQVDHAKFTSAKVFPRRRTSGEGFEGEWSGRHAYNLDHVGCVALVYCAELSKRKQKVPGIVQLVFGILRQSPQIFYGCVNIGRGIAAEDINQGGDKTKESANYGAERTCDCGSSCYGVYECTYSNNTCQHKQNMNIDGYCTFIAKKYCKQRAAFSSVSKVI